MSFIITMTLPRHHPPPPPTPQNQANKQSKQKQTDKTKQTIQNKPSHIHPIHTLLYCTTVQDKIYDAVHCILYDKLAMRPYQIQIFS